MPTSLYDLPFDQYSRQRIVADTLNGLRQKTERFSVLDVGGYKGKTAEFLPNDRIKVLDVFDVQDKDYIKGDGTNLRLEDDSFDFTVSFDVLEHIDKNHRERFILECARVAKRGFFLCCPFENGLGHTTTAEKNLDDIYKRLTGHDHQWLREHIDNKLPTAEAIEAILKRGKLHFAKRYSNRLEDWVAMQMIFFYSDALGVVSTQAGDLNRYYNNNFNIFENDVSQDDAYRVIYFISEDQANATKVRQLFVRNKPAARPLSIAEKIPPAITEIIEQKLDEQKQIIAAKNTDISRLEKGITDLRGSLSWKLTEPLRYLSNLLKRKA